MNALGRLVARLIDRIIATAEPDPDGMQDGDATPPPEKAPAKTGRVKPDDEVPGWRREHRRRQG